MLSSEGIVSGTPATAGDYTCTITATDTYGNPGSRTYFIFINGISARLAEDTAGWLRGEGNAMGFRGSGGTISGAVGFAAGRVGQAFSFDGGGGHVALPASLFPFPTSGTGNAPFSFEAWFSTTTGGVILGQQNVAPFTTTSAAVPAIYVGLDGKLRIEMFWGGVAGGLFHPARMDNGRWHHVAAVYDGTAVTGYLDGTPFASAARTQTAYSATYFYKLGTGVSASRISTPGGWFHFAGLIDEPAIYHRALTAAEVTALYAAGNRGKSTQPAFTAIVQNGANLDLPMEGWPNLRFQLQHTPSLSPPTWTGLQPTRVTDPAGAALFTPAMPAGDMGFFRAVEVP